MATRQLRRGVEPPPVPVLMYHQLGTPAGVGARQQKFWVRERAFQQQLTYLRRNGYRAALLRELQAPSLVSWGARVILTFDDGAISDYEVAYPLLYQAGARAEFFISTANVGRAGYVSWRQIQEMQRAGMSFQSHGHDHVALSRLPRNELLRQLRLSKELLEQHLSQGVRFLAAPYGMVSRGVIECALQLGYQGVCTSFPWPARPATTVISRVAVYRATSLQGFEDLVRGEPATYALRVARTALLYLPKQMLWRCRPQTLGVASVGKAA